MTNRTFLKNKFAAATAAAILITTIPAFASADFLTRELDIGSRGGDVGTLQTFLAQDTTIYPQGLVTDYFGLLTHSAVSNFQARNGIATVGRVGPITLAAINAQMGSESTDLTEGAGKITNYGPAQPVLSGLYSSVGSNSAVVTWNSNVPATARVMYSTVWPFSYRTASSVTNSSSLSTAQSVAISGLASNTVYYYVVESLDPQGNFSWSSNPSTFRTQ